MKKKILIILFCIISTFLGCTMEKKYYNVEINHALNDSVNLNLALIAATRNLSLTYHSDIFGDVRCYDEFDNGGLINGCSGWVRFNKGDQCISSSQQNACAALDIRLKKQGYNLSASEFVSGYLSLQQMLYDKQQNEEINKVKKAREQLIENMANGK
ncbi:MAG TPA: hypothetical protein PLP75_01610 [Burkholderiales bacterium]|nr:hypothetical protein [Burkholderiales bacterium]